MPVDTGPCQEGKRISTFSSASAGRVLLVVPALLFCLVCVLVYALLIDGLCWSKLGQLLALQLQPRKRSELRWASNIQKKRQGALPVDASAQVLQIHKLICGVCDAGCDRHLA